MQSLVSLPLLTGIIVNIAIIVYRLEAWTCCMRSWGDVKTTYWRSLICDLQHFSDQASLCWSADQGWAAPRHIFAWSWSWVLVEQVFGFSSFSMKLSSLITAHFINYFHFLRSHLRWGKSSLSLPIILAGSRQVLMASRKKAVDVPTLPLKIDSFKGRIF